MVTVRCFWNAPGAVVPDNFYSRAITCPGLHAPSDYVRDFRCYCPLSARPVTSDTGCYHAPDRYSRHWGRDHRNGRTNWFSNRRWNRWRSYRHWHWTQRLFATPLAPNRAARRGPGRTEHSVSKERVG